jgi:outer membrane receptor protein involved in Fe transport
VWVKNLTNAFYYTNMIDASGIGFIYTHQNARRTYGVTFDMTF